MKENCTPLSLFLTMILGLMSFMNLKLAEASVAIPQTLPKLSSLKDEGSTDPKQMITLKIWLRPRNEKLLSTLAKTLSDPQSSEYAQWLSPDQFVQKFGPDPAKLEHLKNFLVSHKFTLVTTGETSPMYLTAQAAVADIQAAFHVQIHNFDFDDMVIHANIADPVIDDDAVGKQILWIGGLNNRYLTMHARRPEETGRKHLGSRSAPKKNSDVASASVPLTHNCFSGNVETKVFTSADGTIIAKYTGNRYLSDARAQCGYTPEDIRTAYGLKPAYEKNIDGRDQSVAIIDPWGSADPEADLKAFSELYHLPNLSKDDFRIHHLSGSVITGPWSELQQEWSLETSLDLQWVHAIAPRAKIELVIPGEQTLDNLLGAISYVVDNHLANVVSNSWSDYESEIDLATQQAYDSVLKQATVCGIALNFSSGDAGDFSGDENFKDVIFPSSAYITIVGGTSLALNADRSIRFQTGWGMTYTYITDKDSQFSDSVAEKNTPFAMPSPALYDGGAGGGESRVTAKPFYQAKLPGQMRMIPDIAFVADPKTGVAMLEPTFDSEGNPTPDHQTLTPMGGTSAACPIFSAVWALASQNAGRALGLATPALYQLPAGAITDIVPLSIGTNVSGSINGVAISAAELSLPVGATTGTAIFSVFGIHGTAPSSWEVISFGNDGSLVTAPGWDPVTGLGTPNGMEFLNALKK